MNATAPEVLEKVVAPWVSAGIVDHGYYHLGGHVARAADVAGLSPAQLVEAWGLGFEGSPFRPVPDHLDVLRFAVHPLMALATPAPAAARPWPTYPSGFLSGPALAPVWLLDRTRVPIGAELWRRSTSGEQLLATFDGPAAGWRGARGYYPPVHLVGTRAKWHDLDLPAEILGAGAFVELVSVGPDAPGAGWDQVRPHVWRRVVPRSEVSELFELVLTCRYRDVPCRILQHTPQQSRLLLLDVDPLAARAVGAEEADIGAFEVTAATIELSGTGGTTRTLAPTQAPPPSPASPGRGSHLGDASASAHARPEPPSGQAPDPSEALNTLIQSLLAEPDLAGDDWDAFALLATVAPESSSMSLYRYVAAAPPKPTPIRSTGHGPLLDVHAATAAPDGTSWRVLILKFHRASGRGDVDFAYGDDAESWRITPTTLPDIVERLRPT